MQATPPTDTRLSKAAYLAAFHDDAAAMVEAASRGLAAPVPSCPAWTVAGLIAHTGMIYCRNSKRVRRREQTAEPFDPTDFSPDPAVVAWLQQGAKDPAIPAGLLEWFAGAAADLEAALRDAEPDEPVYTWWPPEQRVGFYHRRMAHETAVHRWDAQLAHACTAPIEATLARDGVDEVMELIVPRSRQVSKVPAHGESYHFHRTDGPGEWWLRFDGAAVDIRRDHRKGDVAARGTASDLLLFHWHRIPADRLEVVGDAALLDRYFELVPPR